MYFVPLLGGVGAALTTGVSYIIYFTVGTFFAERVYPVGYDKARTAMEAVLLTAYAAFASFSDKKLFTIIAGIVLIPVLILIERRNVLLIADYMRDYIGGFIRKFRKKGGSENG